MVLPACSVVAILAASEWLFWGSALCSAFRASVCTAVEPVSEELPLLAWGESRTLGVVADYKRRHGGVCHTIYAADMKTVVRTQDCVDWCPLLGAKIGDVTGS